MSKTQQAMKLMDEDSRFKVRLEHTGASEPKWVFRFCGDFICNATKYKYILEDMVDWENSRQRKLGGGQ